MMKLIKLTKMKNLTIFNEFENLDDKKSKYRETVLTKLGSKQHPHENDNNQYDTKMQEFDLSMDQNENSVHDKDTSLTSSEIKILKARLSIISDHVLQEASKRLSSNEFRNLY